MLLVGSLAYDTVTSPAGSVENELGGSATYGGLAAAFHSRISNRGSVGIVGVVGDDFLLEDRELLKNAGLDLTGLEIPLTELLENAREIENSVREVFEKSMTMLPGPEGDEESFSDPSFG